MLRVQNELGKFHEDVEKSTRDVAFGFINSLMVVSPPGTGKQTTVEQELARHNIPFYRANLNFAWNVDNAIRQIDDAIAENKFIIFEEFDTLRDSRSAIIRHIVKVMTENNPRGLFFMFHTVPNEVDLMPLLARVDRKIVNTTSPLYN